MNKGIIYLPYSLKKVLKEKVFIGPCYWWIHTNIFDDTANKYIRQSHGIDLYVQHSSIHSTHWQLVNVIVQTMTGLVWLIFSRSYTMLIDLINEILVIHAPPGRKSAKLIYTNMRLASWMLICKQVYDVTISRPGTVVQPELFKHLS